MKVLANAAGPYVAAADLCIDNAITHAVNRVVPGQVFSFDPGDAVDVEFLLECGAIIAPSGTAATPEEYVASVEDAIKVAEQQDADRAAAREARAIRAARADKATG